MSRTKWMILGPVMLGLAAVSSAASDTSGTSRPAMLAGDATTTAQGDVDWIARGRYIVRTTGCNDCHTAGYMPAHGEVPEQQWLAGDSVGFRGPWGTTYPTNLRLYMEQLEEDDWVSLARNIETRPPMPWFNLRHMSNEDLRALYRFIRHLGPAGKPAPAAVAPDEEPKTAYILFVPQTPRKRM